MDVTYSKHKFVQRQSDEEKRNQFQAMLYNANFTELFQKSSPGTFMPVFIPYEVLMNEQVSPKNAMLFGTCFYAPTSDPVAIAFHSGLFFIGTGPKPKTRRRISTIANYEEVCDLPEGVYQSTVRYHLVPDDITIKGLFILFYIDDAPEQYIGTKRHGVLSKSSEKIYAHSVRIANFRIITDLDTMPDIVTDAHVFINIPHKRLYKFSKTGELGMPYSIENLTRIFSPYNISTGFFKTHRLFLDTDLNRVELSQISPTEFSVIQYPADVTIFSLSFEENEVESVVVNEKITLSSIKASSDRIKIDNKVYGPVSSIIVTLKELPETTP